MNYSHKVRVTPGNAPNFFFFFTFQRHIFIDISHSDIKCTKTTKTGFISFKVAALLVQTGSSDLGEHQCHWTARLGFMTCSNIAIPPQWFHLRRDRERWHWVIQSLYRFYHSEPQLPSPLIFNHDKHTHTQHISVFSRLLTYMTYCARTAHPPHQSHYWLELIGS